MTTTLAAFCCGLIFGLGLIVSQMSNPQKVIGFLDLFGRWDPSLAFVMGGALAVSAVGFAVAKRAGRSYLALDLHVPDRRDVDAPLVAGALLFGAGWGLAGFCPGPALVGVGAGSGGALVFVGAMIAGMLLHRVWQRRAAAAPAAAGDA